MPKIKYLCKFPKLQRNRELPRLNKSYSFAKTHQVLLKEYKPNLAELRMIRNKIDTLYDRNVQKQRMKAQRGSQEPKMKEMAPKKWVKIPVEYF